jgi:hypothetical protein
MPEAGTTANRMIKRDPKRRAEADAELERGKRWVGWKMRKVNGRNIFTCRPQLSPAEQILADAGRK